MLDFLFSLNPWLLITLIGFTVVAVILTVSLALTMVIVYLEELVGSVVDTLKNSQSSLN